jgi:hypothetical protein
LYDEAVAGRLQTLAVMTNSTEEYAKTTLGISDEHWEGFIQQEIAAYYCCQHRNNHFSLHKGSWSNYGPKPTYRESHWHPNMEFDFGRPVKHGQIDWWGEVDTDRFYCIGDHDRWDKSFARQFEHGMVVCRLAVSSINNVGADPVRTVSLPKPCRRLGHDNSLGPLITSIELANGTGALLAWGEEEMTETEVIAQVMGNPQFRQRVRAIAAVKALSVLGEATPDAQELAWSRLVVADGYDGWTESLLILASTTPATPEAAYSATDAQYATALNNVLAQVILAKEL